MTVSEDSREVRQLADELRKMREWLTGNGHAGIFDRLTTMERDVYGNENTDEPGLIKDMRAVRSTSSQNTYILKQVRWLAILALMLAGGIAVAHSSEPAWFGDLMKWVLAAL